MTTLPPLPDDFEPTRATLHAYARAAAAIPRAHADPHDQWWHAALAVTSHGMVTDRLWLADGATATITMDLTTHEVKFATSTGDFTVYSMQDGMTGSELADALIADAAGLGLHDTYDREKFENDERREYDREVAVGFVAALTAVNDVMKGYHDSLDGDVGPINLWPHGFDLAFEWFGTRAETFEEDGEVSEHLSQLNFGWYPAGDAYFYSNPWPFEADVLLSTDLPGHARWHTDGWEGSKLAYDDVAGRDDGGEVVRAYWRRVFDVAAPTLTD
jgi:hypothetical protein